MSESKHTPGKWHYGEPVRSHKMPMVWDELGSQVADCRGAFSREYDESLANAHLIAAAPELLDRLKVLETRLTAVGRAFYGDGKASSLKAALAGWVDDIEPARAAIAKAEGGAP